MQGGQWEYVVTPDNGGTTMYLGVNLTKTNVDFNANNLVIFQPSQISLVQNTAPISCGGYSLMGAIGGTKFDGELGTPTGAFGSFSGQLSSNGQSISNGKYSGQACTTMPSKVSGTLTGYTVAPLNGTFTGKLTSTANGASVVTVSSPTERRLLSPGITGTFVENGVTTSFADMAGNRLEPSLRRISFFWRRYGQRERKVAVQRHGALEPDSDPDRFVSRRSQ